MKPRGDDVKKQTNVILTVAVLLLVSVASVLPGSQASTIQPKDDGAPGHPLWNVVTYEIKHDMVSEFEDLLDEARVAYERIGAKRYVLQVVRGPSATYMVVTPRNAFADFDAPARSLAKAVGEAGAAEWITRASKCLKNRRVDTFRLRTDLAIPLAEGRTPTLMSLRTVETLPGRWPDYGAWLAKEWVPAMKQARINGVYYLNQAFGGFQRFWFEIRLHDNWASFDDPLLETLGTERARELRAGEAEMTHGPVVKILRLRPDLSVVP